MDRGDESFKNRTQWLLADSTIFRADENAIAKDGSEEDDLVMKDFRLYVRRKNLKLGMGHASYWASLVDALDRGIVADVQAYETVLAKYKNAE